MINNKLHTDLLPIIFEIEGFKIENTSKQKITNITNYQIFQKLLNNKLKLLNERKFILNTSDLYNTFLNAASLSKSSATEARKPKNFERLHGEFKFLLNNKKEARKIFLLENPRV